MESPSLISDVPHLIVALAVLINVVKTKPALNKSIFLISIRICSLRLAHPRRAMFYY
ncbi:hypothetical protein ALQ44_200113 [Pseudomonas syringae pv. pisi]|uniref:Uncharacterized protein n=1 Tax=Pseudomonas syringae pv. pisi TaxID=59510 RepID=A0A3M3U5D1_PSESJ|nr:hypothetical protein ALQ44_200113 [Pseudomonas syringae pv. pisi]